MFLATRNLITFDEKTFVMVSESDLEGYNAESLAVNVGSGLWEISLVYRVQFASQAAFAGFSYLWLQCHAHKDKKALAESIGSESCSLEAEQPANGHHCQLQGVVVNPWMAEFLGVFLSCTRTYEEGMQCEAPTPVCSNQGVQLLGSVYMCCNKLTATCTKVNGYRLKLLTLLAEYVYMYYFLVHSVLAIFLESFLPACYFWPALKAGKGSIFGKPGCISLPTLPLIWLISSLKFLGPRRTELDQCIDHMCLCHCVRCACFAQSIQWVSRSRSNRLAVFWGICFLFWGICSLCCS